MDHFHLTLTTAGRHPCFPEEAGRRLAVRAIATVAREALVLFCIVDDHVHVVVRCDRARAGRLCQALRSTFAPLAASPIATAHVQSITERSHLAALVRYMLIQPLKHRVPEHPALWSGSCFQDLVGARVAAPLSIATSLPRLRMREALPHVGLPAEPIAPVTDDGLRVAGARRIVAAVASALALGPGIGGRSAGAVGARCAAAALCRRAGIAPAEIAWALAVPGRSARRASEGVADPAVLRATCIRLALEAAVDRHPMLTGEEEVSYQLPGD